MDKMDKELLDELKSEHPDADLYVVEADEHAVVLRTPEKAHLARFFATADDPKKRLQAQENLVVDALVWPEREQVKALLAKKPGLVVTFAAEALKIAGISEEARVKKL